MKKYLEIGKVIGTKGLKGEFKLQAWCDNPEFVKKFKYLYTKNGENKFEIRSVRIWKSTAVVAVKEITTCEEANRLINKIFYIDREEVKLEKGRYFIQDLIGLDVIDEMSEKNYGKITDVIKTGANDVYQVTDAQGKNYLVPVIPDVVKKVDISETNAVYITPIKGIFDDEN